MGDGQALHTWVSLRDSGAVNHYFQHYPSDSVADEIWFWSEPSGEDNSMIEDATFVVAVGVALGILILCVAILEVLEVLV